MMPHGEGHLRHRDKRQRGESSALRRRVGDSFQSARRVQRPSLAAQRSCRRQAPAPKPVCALACVLCAHVFAHARVCPLCACMCERERVTQCAARDGSAPRSASVPPCSACERAAPHAPVRTRATTPSKPRRSDKTESRHTLANNASTVHLLHASAAIARTSCPTLQPLSGVNASNQQRESLAVRIDRACWICRLDLRAGGRRTRVCASECARVAIARNGDLKSGRRHTERGVDDIVDPSAHRLGETLV